MANKKRSNRIIVFSAAIICVLCVLLLLFFGVPKTVTAELGNTSDIKLSDFLFAGDPDKLEPVTDLSEIDLSKCGENTVVFKNHGIEMRAKLVVKDTIAPKAEPLENAVYYIGSEFVPKEFFSEIKDEQDVIVSVEPEEDISSIGSRGIAFLLEDASGNRSESVVYIDFKTDDQGPQIISNKPIFITPITENVSLLDGLDYKDNVSPKEKIKTSIDDSAVDYYVTGKYAADIVLEDECGNKTTVERDVNIYTDTYFEAFTAPYDEDIDKMVDEILAEIITEGMSDREKITACYNWTVDNITYKPSVDYSFMDDIHAMSIPFASKMLVTKKGACFAYAAVGCYFMNKLGIPVNLVVGDGSDVWGGFELHCWNQVYCDGQWLLYDPMYEPLFAGQLHFCLIPSEETFDQTHMWDLSKYPWS